VRRLAPNGRVHQPSVPDVSQSALGISKVRRYALSLITTTADALLLNRDESCRQPASASSQHEQPAASGCSISPSDELARAARLVHCEWVHVLEGTTMRWTPGGRSKDLEDLRGQTGGGGGGMMLGGRGMGIGGAVIALILSLVFGVNIFDSGGGNP